MFQVTCKIDPVFFISYHLSPGHGVVASVDRPHKLPAFVEQNVGAARGFLSMPLPGGVVLLPPADADVTVVTPDLVRVSWNGESISQVFYGKKRLRNNG